MTEFENLKRNYVLTIQIGISSSSKISYNEAKQGNDVLHKFCENLIEGSIYDDETKKQMKHELKLLKEALTEEIEKTYK